MGLKFNKVINIVPVYPFLLAGLLQFLGIAPIVPTTILLSIAAVLILFINKNGCVPLNKIVIGGLIFTIYIFFSGLLNHTEILKTVYYLNFIIIPIGIYIIVNGITVSSKLIFQFANILALFQVPILLIQTKFSETLISISAKKYEPIDGMYGTFPIADDHGLGFFLVCLLYAHLFVFRELRYKSFFGFLSIIICLILIGSKISKVLALLIIIVFLADKFGIKFKLSFSKVIIAIIILVVLFQSPLIEVISHYLGSAELISINENVTNQLVERGVAGRLQTIFYFYLTKTFLIIGNGPASYFNPFTREFTFNINYSQLIWFYFDIGFIGLILFFVWIFNIYTHQLKSGKLRSNTDFIFFIFLVYSLFTTTLNSITILFTFFMTVKVLRDANKENLSKYESVRLSIS